MTKNLKLNNKILDTSKSSHRYSSNGSRHISNKSKSSNKKKSLASRNSSYKSA